MTSSQVLFSYPGRGSKYGRNCYENRLKEDRQANPKTGLSINIGKEAPVRPSLHG
jgi:hypothetical protein